MEHHKERVVSNLPVTDHIANTYPIIVENNSNTYGILLQW